MRPVRVQIKSEYSSLNEDDSGAHRAETECSFTLGHLGEAFHDCTYRPTTPLPESGFMAVLGLSPDCPGGDAAAGYFCLAGGSHRAQSVTRRSRCAQNAGRAAAQSAGAYFPAASSSPPTRTRRRPATPISKREVYGALLIDPASPADFKVLTASAGGPAAAQILGTVGSQVGALLSASGFAAPSVEDVVPTTAADPRQASLVGIVYAAGDHRLSQRVSAAYPLAAAGRAPGRHADSGARRRILACQRGAVRLPHD